MTRIHRLLAAVLYVVLFFALFPWYRYVIDIDAISYIHVAQRVAGGAYAFSLNGYWSPLISWLLAPFIRSGFDPVLSAKYINGLLGLLSLYSCYTLTDRFRMHETFRRVLPYALAVLFVSYAFYELCADLLQLFLLLLYMNIICSASLAKDNLRIAFAGLAAGICYYAKAYSLPFFILHFPVVLFFALKKEAPQHFMKAYLQKLVLAFAVCFVCAAPYVLAISQKYGSFRISNAGTLNTSWFLSPGLSDDRTIVALPPFGDATSYWDDPTYAQQKWVGPFTSAHHFAVQVKIAISNFFRYLGLLHTMSILVFVILTGFLYTWWKRRQNMPAQEIVLLATTLLYPAGYLLIFIEWRYIWLLPVCFLLMGGLLLTHLITTGSIPVKAMLPATLLLCGTFLYQPANELQDLRYSYKDVYDMADVFRKQHIRGKFLLQYRSFPPYGKTVALCYLTGSQLYGPVKLDYTLAEFFDAVKKYEIDYYLYYYDSPNEKEVFLQSPYAKAGIQVYPDIFPGVVLVRFK